MSLPTCKESVKSSPSREDGERRGEEAYLRKLESEGAGESLLGSLLRRSGNGPAREIPWFAHRLAIGDDDHKHRFLQCSASDRLHDERLDDFAIQLGRQGCDAGESDLFNQLAGCCRVSDTVALCVAVHEPDLNAILVKESRNFGNPAEDEL